MRVVPLALGGTLALVLGDPVSAQTRARVPQSSARQDASGGFRTDRLSRSEIKTWSAIVEMVTAEDREGRSRYPTLRALWDAVDTSGHTVYVEMRDPKAPPSYIAGRFAITRVDPEGKAHEGVLILNLRAIDKASTGPGAARADGFIPFAGLDKKERYAEVIGHELAHAVWHFADPERARLGARLQGELESLVARWYHARVRGKREERSEPEGALVRLARELEETAEAAEKAIWNELRSGGGRR